jgi:hypothetical protein
MGSLSAERALQLLGADINGHDLVAGHANRNGLTLLTTPHRWQWRQRERRERQEPKHDGSRLVAFSAGLLFLLGVGLLSVSIAAQYRYFLAERHQITASMIESGALDAGMIIFALLALGAARKGLHARPERVLIVGCAAASAVMNYANADPGNWRSVAAWTMPPIFLAVVADRVIAITRRHFLGMAEGRSAWRDAVAWLAKAGRAFAFLALYSLRFLLAPPSTAKGVRQAVLNVTPLPAPPPVLELPERVAEQPSLRPRRACRSDDGLTKTERLLTLVTLRHGDLVGIPLDEVSKIATACAADVDMHPASARSALLAAVRRAIATCGSDSR